MPFSYQYFAPSAHFSGTPAVSSGFARLGLSILMMGAEMIPLPANTFEIADKHHVPIGVTRRWATVSINSSVRSSSRGLRLVISSSHNTRGT
ncbi:MAG TPA: hypothetical protein VNE63_17855 [Candidatus Acidoferrales bacterium]|nr:hypothetical protein [Candidatus Acidoferrales bacterium]